MEKITKTRVDHILRQKAANREFRTHQDYRNNKAVNGIEEMKIIPEPLSMDLF